MILPKNYYWIPGYENRYALYYDANENRFNNSVWSAIYPGCHDKLVALVPKSYSPKVYSLSKNGEKVTYTIELLQRQIRAFLQSRNMMPRGLPQVECAAGFDEADSMKPTTRPAITVDVEGVVRGEYQAGMLSEKRWVVGRQENFNITFNSHPTSFTNIDDAQASATERAKSNPGVEYLVLETMLKVVDAGVTVTQLS